MAFDAIEVCFGELNMRAEEHVMKAVQQVDVNVDKEKLIRAIKATDFVDELIYYIFNVQEPDDDNLSAEVICRKLVKHGLIDKVDGYYEPKDEYTEDEILREQCRAFMSIVEQTKKSESTDCQWK